MKIPQLFMVHFAGGSSFSFQPIATLLREFDVVTLELPGRGRRVREELLTDFNQAADDIFCQIIKKRTFSRFMIFGHSMGAYLSLAVTKKLEKVGEFPEHLIVSGNAGPGVHSGTNRHLLSEEDFWKEVKLLGGLPEELFQSKELTEFYLPVLRSDFKIAEDHPLDLLQQVRTPIFAMMGDKEQKVSEISNWGRFTSTSFSNEVLEGGHFFINDHPGRIAKLIRQKYDQGKESKH